MTAGPSARTWLLHPAVVFSGVWAIALLAWLFAPAAVRQEAISGTRSGSTHAFVYIAACLVAFVAGAVAGGLVLPSRRPAPLTCTGYPGLRGVARICALAPLFGGAIWMARATLLVGSPQALAQMFLNGQSVVDLKSAVFNPAELAPFTTLVHLSPPAVSMLLLNRKLAGWSRFDRLLMAGLILLAMLRTFVLAERVAGLGVAAAIAVTLILTADKLHPRRVAGLGFVGLVVVWFAWSGGEFTRSYMDKNGSAEADLSIANFRSSLTYSQERLGVYLFSAVDNGVVIINESPGQAFPANFAPVLARLPGVSAQPGAGMLYESSLNREFTGESMPGKFYLDARDLGVVLALAYGVVFGITWRLAALKSPAGIVLYAGLMHVLLDTYRSAFLFDLQGIACFAAAGLLLLLQRRLVARSEQSPSSAATAPALAHAAARSSVAKFRQR